MGEKMQIGIKIYPEDITYAKKIAPYADFFEVMAIPGSNFRKLKALKKPFTIHTIHYHWGFNAADLVKAAEINKLGVDTATHAADILDADTIVIHPGRLNNEHCSLKQSIRFLKRLDSRFLIENVPSQLKGEQSLRVGQSIIELKRVLKETRKGFCLDFAHAAEHAHMNGMYYVNYIKKLLKLRPRYFHISDTRIRTKKDLHLHLKEGDLRLDYLTDLIPDPENSRILIETSHDFRKQHRDIRILRGG